MSDYFSELRRYGTVWEATICIAGNHELTLDPKYNYWVCRQFLPLEQTEKLDGPAREALIKRSCTSLEGEAFSVVTIKFYGSPWQPKRHDWAFYVPRGDIDVKWDQILREVNCGNDLVKMSY